MIEIEIDFSALYALDEDLKTLEGLFENPEFLQRIRPIIATHFKDVWDTEGQSIGEDWDGNELEQSGRLKSSLTDSEELALEIRDKLISIGSNVSYAPFVDEMFKFMGVNDVLASELSQVITEYMKDRGNLSWE